MDALVLQVKSLGLSLAEKVAVPGFTLKPYFSNLAVVAGQKKGRLLELSDSKAAVILNSQHPMASKLADGKPGRAEIVVSAIISLVNRAEEKLTDHHQHQLHHHLVMSMVADS